jgi:hypothetical protein
MLSLVSFFALNATLYSGIAEDLPAAEDVEKQVLEYRRALKTAEIQLSQATYSKENGPPDDERRTKIWFDGKKLRNDLVYRLSGEKTYHREIHGRHCEREGYLLYYTDEKPPPGVAYGLEFHKIGPDTDPASCPVIDPRLLGLIIRPSYNLPDSHLDEFVRPSDRHPPSIRKTRVNGKELLLVEYTFLSGTRVREWIATDRGPSIVRMESEYDKDGKPCIHSLVCDFADAPTAGGYWFPKSCTYHYTIDGKMGALREVATIDVISLNKPIPPEAFTLAGMGITQGSTITGLPRADKADGLPEWNGDTIITPKRPVVPLASPAIMPGWRNPLLLGGSVFLALLAGLVIWNAFLRKKRA